MSKPDFTRDDGSLSVPIIEANTPDMHWQDDNADIQRFIATLKASGVKTITWHAYKGACSECAVNDGQTVSTGSRFKSGAFLPPNHPHCPCEWTDGTGKRYAWTGVDGEYKQVKDDNGH